MAAIRALLRVCVGLGAGWFARAAWAGHEDAKILAISLSVVLIVLELGESAHK
jgi:hypothetical protein